MARDLAGTGPEFSICVPTWNGAAFIGGLLESALAQAYPHWRLYVGDNASSDDLEQLMRSYQQSRICYRRWDRHIGANENFNRTMGLAETDWVLPIGADDRLDPDALLKMAAAIESGDSDERPPVVMVVAPCRRVGLDGTSAESDYYGSQVPAPIDPGRYDSRRWLALAASGGPFPWNIGSMVFRRSALVESGAFRPDVGLSADMELIFRIGAHGDVVYVDQPLMDFAVHADSDGNVQWARNRRDARAEVPLARALLAALEAHEAARAVGSAERVAVRSGAARAYLQRAAQHRVLSGGRGRRGALLDVLRALRLSMRTVIAPQSLAVSFGSVVAPVTIIRWVSAAMQRRRHAADR